MINRQQDILESYDIPCRSYSGRGMYGKRCLGFELDSHSDYHNFLIDVAMDFPDEACLFRDVKYDSLGLGMIFYLQNVSMDD